MALKKHEQTALTMIETTAKMLKGVGNEEEMITKIIQPQIDSFEAETGLKLKFNFDSEGDLIETINLKGDYVRMRKSGDFMVARCKILSVPIEIKTFKPDEFSHKNNAIVEALQEMIKIVQDSAELNTFTENADLSRFPWEAISGEELSTDDDAIADIITDETIASDIVTEGTAALEGDNVQVNEPLAEIASEQQQTAQTEDSNSPADALEAPADKVGSLL
jgi:hypothetical protein